MSWSCVAVLHEFILSVKHTHRVDGRNLTPGYPAHRDVVSLAEWWSDSLTDGPKCLLQELCALSNAPSNTSSPFLCTDKIAELMLISIPASSNMLYQTVRIRKSYDLNYIFNMSWSDMKTNPVPFISQVLSKLFSSRSAKTMQAHFQHADTHDSQEQVTARRFQNKSPTFSI